MSLLRADLLALARRRHVQIMALVGSLLALVISLRSEGADLERDMATLIGIGGLVVALILGAPALVRDLERGAFGALSAAGPRSSDLAWMRLGSRTIGLGGILLLWGVIGQAGGLVAGNGINGDVAVHLLLTGEVLILVLLAAAGAATLLGVIGGGIFGVAVLIAAQTVVNMKAAADQALLGTGGAVIEVAYWMLPRALPSPMITELQASDEAGPAAPQVEINGNIVDVPAAALDSVLWTAAWCGIFVVLAIFGLSRREL